jgi:hypothetical protein
LQPHGGADVKKPGEVDLEALGPMSNTKEPGMESVVMDRETRVSDFPANEAYLSGISWAAVIAGAFVTAALYLILLALGSGLGFSSVSPWGNRGLSASTVSKGAIIWLIITQILAAATGGYLAGRMRTKWAIIHSDEVYFRDTAHGFLVWAVALVITAAFLTSAAISMAGEIARSSASSAATTPAGEAGPYFRDLLLRSDHFGPDHTDPYLQAEVDHIFAHDLEQKGLSDADKKYLTRMVADRTGLPEVDAQTRVETIFSHVKQSVDLTRKATAEFFIWLFIALLAGAFFASVFATLGGRERDRVKLLDGRTF